MRNRAIRLLSVLIFSAWVAACGDDGGSTVDAPVCVPVDDGNVCTTDVCQAGQPVHNPVPAGTACPTGACNATGMCVAPTCTDNMENGTETDVDCGGSCAPGSTCDDGEGCAAGTDCDSGVCGGTTCTAAACGDGVVQAGEMCDDGNATNGDGCDDGVGGTCRQTGCGNGTVAGTEICDDGNNTNGDGCDNNCTATACGNGVITGTEVCDDADLASGDGCSATCTVETGYTCTTTVPSVCTTTCGDGVIAGTEACDDVAPAESGDGCSATCTVETGFICTGSPSVCATVCGDGLIGGAETCDQGGGNVIPGDGCSATCTVENGYSCMGTPSVCAQLCGNGAINAGETCDDGNRVSVDGCSSTCQIEANEVEPNEDGTIAINGSTFLGNDFDTGGVAVTNATAQGVINASDGNTARIAALTPAGDEDVFAITNNTATRLELRLDTWNRATGFGVGVQCGNSIDTGINVRNAAGAVLRSNDDRTPTLDQCSGVEWVLAPGATIYAHVTEYGDNNAIPGYGLQIRFFEIVCGDTRQVFGVEECDDNNLTAGDGCSATCTIEGTSETEPNEDGTPQTGGSGITGNDFDNAGGMAVANATTQGVVNVATTGRTWLAGFAAAGDEDVFAVTNSGTTPFEVQANTWDPLEGLNRPCLPATVDTGINVRDAAGVVQTSNDSRASGDGCSRVTFFVAPGQSRYIHVTENGDNLAIARYVLQITRRAIVCGDGTVTSAFEECDDGNTVDADACTNTCLLGGVVNEVEPNGTSAEADASTLQVTATTMIRAAIATAGDVDRFKVTVAVPTVVRFETFVGAPGDCVPSTTMDLRLFDAASASIINDVDSTGIGSCAALVFHLAAGSYYVQAEERGNNAIIAKYFLEVAFQTDRLVESEPAGMMGVNDTFGTASVNLLAPPTNNVYVFGDHTVETDLDVYSLTVPAGARIRIEAIEGDRATETCESNGVDTIFRLRDQTGAIIVTDDDSGRGFCSLIDGFGTSPAYSGARNATATTQTYYIEAGTNGTSVADRTYVYRLAVSIR